MNTVPISFIGYGNMAQALIKGLLKNGFKALSASSPSLQSRSKEKGLTTFCNNKEAVKGAQVVVLAVKPMQMQQVLEEISPSLRPNTLLISVAAGLNLTWFAKRIKQDQAVIRTMPNMPVAAGLGVTSLMANKHTSAVQKKLAQDIFSSLGLAVWMDKEEDMDIVTALSGSGPAYVYYFMESLIDAAVALGLNEKVARLMTFQTVGGALALAQESDLSLNQLRCKVTSVKGTTAAALDILQPQFHNLLVQAIKAAKDRANELGDQMCQL